MKLNNLACLLSLLALPCHGAIATAQVGQSATMTVTADGTNTVLNPFSYQWQKDGIDLPGAISASYNIPSVVSADAGAYTVTVSNSKGSVISDTATLSIISIGTIALSVNVTGASMPMGYIETYQWLKDGRTVQSGSKSYSITDLTEHKYQVLITWYKLSPLK